MPKKTNEERRRERHEVRVRQHQGEHHVRAIMRAGMQRIDAPKVLRQLRLVRLNRALHRRLDPALDHAQQLVRVGKDPVHLSQRRPPAILLDSNVAIHIPSLASSITCGVVVWRGIRSRHPSKRLMHAFSEARRDACARAFAHRNAKPPARSDHQSNHHPARRLGQERCTRAHGICARGTTVTAIRIWETARAGSSKHGSGKSNVLGVADLVDEGRYEGARILIGGISAHAKLVLQDLKQRARDEVVRADFVLRGVDRWPVVALRILVCLRLCRDQS
mmetsp:Transcript_19221/g.58132  ORF Transcript_19221/g.58132 Transcript_19221/m.58132 type:complete len:277 (-) Transcript_19221:675-1505(-)